MWLTAVFEINQDIIQILYNKNIEFFEKNIKLFSNNMIDLALKTSQSIQQAKKYYLIVKVFISHSKNNFLFTVLSNFYLMIGIYKI